MQPYNDTIMQPNLILQCPKLLQPWQDFDVRLVPKYSTIFHNFPHFTTEAAPWSKQHQINHVTLKFFMPQSHVALTSFFHYLPFLLLPLLPFAHPFSSSFWFPHEFGSTNQTWLAGKSARLVESFLLICSLKDVFFPCSMDSTAFGRWRPQQPHVAQDRTIEACDPEGRASQCKM